MEFDKENEDKTSQNETEELFTDDSDDLFASDEVEEKESDKQDEKGDDEKKDDEGKPPKSKDSAIIQKQKYREKLKLALKELDDLKSKDKKSDTPNLSEDQQKEQAAREYLATEIRKILKEEESEKTAKELQKTVDFQDELADVLEDYSDFTESQITDLCDELGVSPRQAAKIALRESKLGKGKPKPVLPQPKRGSPELKDTSKKGERPPALSEVSRTLKDLIRQGKL